MLHDYREASKEERIAAVELWLERGGTGARAHDVVCELQAEGLLADAGDVMEWARELHMTEWSPGHQRYVLRPGWRA